MKFRSSHRPVKHTAYDIRNRLLLFESQYMMHKNARWSGGNRYAIVFFNKDMDYSMNKRASQRKSPRSLRILNQPKQPTQWLRTQPATSPEVLQAKTHLLHVLNSIAFPEDRTSGLTPSSKYGKHRGTFISLGVTQSRKNRAKRAAQGMHTRKNVNQNNVKYERLYSALGAYVNTLTPRFFGTSDAHRYQGCIVAKNSQCEWHTDKGNIGPAVITALGTFTGGKLMVETEPR